MSRRILPPLTRAVWQVMLLATVLGFAAPSSILAQPSLPTESLPAPVIDQSTLADLLESGYQFERQRQWADALIHYEDSLRTYPGQHDLNERLQIVRVRYDLSRRLADQSFVDSTRTLGLSESLDLFKEVCLKIQSHYVQPPSWRTLLRRGIRHWEIALHDVDFKNTNRLNVTAADRDESVRYFYKLIATETLTNVAAAQDFVYRVATFGESRLGVPAVSTVMEFVCGATGGLDEYSAFLTPDQLDDVYSQIEGNFVGLGVELKADHGELLITNVISNGPAHKKGILSGDRIVEIDGQRLSEISTEKGAEMLKGERGSNVEISILSNDQTARRVVVQRDLVEVPSVENVHMVDQQAGIGYLKITSFQKTTSRDIDGALWKLHNQGMRVLIVDVRGNPGGLLNESVEVADKFVTEGTIVSTRGRSPNEDYDYKAHQVGTWRVSLVVLIDGDSASASEIFAGAIRDHRRGTVVGTRSYGKGSVQGIFPLRIGKVGVRLTTAKFYSPNGQEISRNGVAPDLEIRHAEKPLLTDSDPVLNAGVEVARQNLAQRSR